MGTCIPVFESFLNNKSFPRIAPEVTIHSQLINMDHQATRDAVQKERMESYVVAYEPIPFITNAGLLIPDAVLFGPADASGEDVVGDNIVEPHLWSVMRYGLLAALSEIAHLAGIPVPELNKMLNPTIFKRRIDEIVGFYSNYGFGPTVDAYDAFNYLRLHAIGGAKGAMNSWIDGLRESGEFHAVDGELIGRTKHTKLADGALKNINKNAAGFWKRPFFMIAFNKEMAKLAAEIAKVNEHYLDTSVSEYPDSVAQAFLFKLTKATQVWFSLCAASQIESYCNQSPLPLEVSAMGIKRASVPFETEVTFRHRELTFTNYDWLGTTDRRNAGGVLGWLSAPKPSTDGY